MSEHIDGDDIDFESLFETKPPSAQEVEAQHAAHEQLKSETMTLVAPHRQSQEKPPFTTCELIVFALIQGPPEGMGAKAILRSILTSYQYYNMQMVDAYTNCIDYRSNGNERQEPNLVIWDFKDSLRDYRLPITSEEPIDFLHETAPTYKVQTSEARIFLSHRLGPQRVGSFRFLDLPPELRNRIYEFCLTVTQPAHKLDIESPWSNKIMLQTSHRANGSTLRGRSCKPNEQDFVLPTLGTMLAPAHACKQMMTEAMPLFFALNPIQFEDWHAFVKTLERMPASLVYRLKHVSFAAHRKSFDFMENWQPSPTFFKHLSVVKGLETFELTTDDDVWLGMRESERRKLGRTLPFASVGEIPGMSDLALVVSKSKKFILNGACPKLKAYLEEESEKLKAEGNIQYRPTTGQE